MKLKAQLLSAILAIGFPVRADEFDSSVKSEIARICKEAAPLVYRFWIRERMADVPILRDFLLDAFSDTGFPPQIKRVVKEALVKNDVVVLHLDESTRKSYGIIPEAQAAHLRRTLAGDLRTFDDVTVSVKTLNQEASESTMAVLAHRALEHRHTLLVQQRPITAEQNDFLVLMHEMAHVRFGRMLEKHFDRLHQRLPVGLARKGSGETNEIHQQLYNFLSERYAYQIECEAAYKTFPKYYDAAYRRDICEDRGEYKNAISRFVIDAYRITDPRVLALRDMSLLDIFMGKNPSAQKPQPPRMKPDAYPVGNGLIAKPAAAAF